MVSGLFDWLIHIPEYVAGFGQLLTQPIAPGVFEWSPLDILGVSAVGAITALIVFKVVRLVVGG